MIPDFDGQPSSRVLVRFGDCDPLGHLNNSRYLDYFINAREDHVREHYGLSLREYYLQGFSWVIAQTNISYLRSANVGEWVQIQSAIRHFTHDELWVEMVMWSEDFNQLKAVLWSKLVHVEIKAGRRAPHSAQMIDNLLSQAVRPIFNPYEITFENRVVELIRLVKSMK